MYFLKYILIIEGRNLEVPSVEDYWNLLGSKKAKIWILISITVICWNEYSEISIIAKGCFNMLGSKKDRYALKSSLEMTVGYKKQKNEVLSLS